MRWQTLVVVWLIAIIGIVVLLKGRWNDEDQ